jgi:O-succinylbenzoate synthase
MSAARRTVDLVQADLLRVRLALVTPFRTAHNTTATKEALLVRVRTNDGVGWGECTAQPSPEYDGETIDGARVALRDHLLPRAFAGAPFDDVPGNAAARAALECALLDARLRAEGVSLAEWLGAVRDTVPAGVAVGLTHGIDELRAIVRGFVDAGYRRVKCKIEPGHDVEWLRAVRAEVGPDIELAADANGSYDLDGARRLFAAVDDLGLQCVEQPCAPGTIADHTLLAAEVSTPICLDESITDVSAAADAIAQGACNAISVKVGRLGLAASKRTQALCQEEGVGALAGGMIETGVGRAALLAVAALPGFTMTGDCSGSERFFGVDGDLTEPFVVVDGALRVPAGPGLGVEPTADRLARAVIARETVTARG